jgi:hypothetical protein
MPPPLPRPQGLVGAAQSLPTNPHDNLRWARSGQEPGVTFSFRA